MKQNPLKKKRLELGVLALYILLYWVVGIYHEPWFDEEQAWQIAKCASLREIFFTLPHYEGHPPLWHLILAIPAKLGVPFEFGLKSVGFLFSVSAAAVLLFCSKLPRALRLSLPFSYFFFYQYGIIVRPYVLMLFVMLLLGMEFKNRNKRPWRTVLLLLLLCLTGAYGIVIAGGLSICIVWEILQEKGVKKSFREIFSDQRTQALSVLLAAAILLILEIMPRHDTYTPEAMTRNGFLICFICALLTFPAECLITSSSWFSKDRMLLQIAYIDKTELAILCLIGIMIWIGILCFSSRKNIKFLLVPYFLFSAFSARVYFSGHHLGVAFVFLLFWLEYQYRDGNSLEIGRILTERIVKTQKDYKIIRYFSRGLLAVCLIVPIYWSVSASYHEFSMIYSFGRDVASSIRQNHMENCSILTSWTVDGSLFQQAEGHEDYVNPYMNGVGTELSAYFNRNMSINLNGGQDKQAFVYHKLASYEESCKEKQRLIELGKPEIIIGKPKIELVYGDLFDYTDYSLVKIIYTNYIWKNAHVKSGMTVFLRNDILSSYSLDPITGIEAIAVNGLSITDEMRAQYESGVPVEEILKPYLDALMGEK